MKKSTTFMCAILLAMAVQANNYLGFQVGFSQPITRLNTSIQDKKTELNSTIYNGLKIGLVYDATIVKGFGMNLGLNYTFGANKTDWKASGSVANFPQVSTSGQYHQLEIPVDWQYKFEIAQNTWLIVYTGPTLQCGLALNQKTKVRYSKDNELVLSEKNVYSKEDMNDLALKRMNVTWGIGAGFQYERYFLRGGYDFGLINPYKAQSFIDLDVNTRGRFDQWQIKLGMYIWEF